MGRRTLKVMPADMINEIPGMYALAANETAENLAWGVFRDAFTTTGTIDGKALCATDHPLAGGGTSSNKGTTALSAAAVSTAVAAMMRWKTPQGRIYIGNMPKYLIVPPELKATAYEITRADLQGSSTAFSDANPVKDLALEPVVVPWLTDTKDWFLAIRPEDQLEGLEFYWGDAPDFANGEERKSLIYWGNVTMSASAGFTTWRQVYGSEVT
jgi:phage major head subunit gpT-like protein